MEGGGEEKKECYLKKRVAENFFFPGFPSELPCCQKAESSHEHIIFSHSGSAFVVSSSSQNQKYNSRDEMPYEPKNILITGGAGFIASHVAILFAKKYPHCKVRSVNSSSSIDRFVARDLSLFLFF